MCALTQSPQLRPRPTRRTFLIPIFTPTRPTPTISILPKPSTTWGVLGRLTPADPTPQPVWALPADPTVQVIGEDEEEEGGGLGEEGRSVGMVDDPKTKLGVQVGDIRTLQKNSKALSRLYEHLKGIKLFPKLSEITNH
jgi:hypothetical protein